MLRRKMTDELEAWRRGTSHKAMFLTGARQTGKSTVIREFGKREYRHYVEINLYENRQAARALADATNVRDFLSRIALFAEGPLVPGETLIFLDEVQERPDIMTMVKFLVADGQFDYALSGSMLGTELKAVRSYPVGSVVERTMRPIDFEEFCWAIGVQPSTLDAIREACSSGLAIDAHIHEAMLANFRTYMVTGGMPEAVVSFLEGNGNLEPVRALQNELNGQYRLDISKYAGARSPRVREMFDQMPAQLIDGNGRFSVSSIGEHARYGRMEKDFLWLVDAGVALKTNCVTEPKSPLMRTAQSPKFKLYQSDTGMLMARYPIATSRSVYLDDAKPNLGALYENVVAQELSAQHVPLYYFMVKKQGEVDFIADGNDGSPVPIEVKSGRHYRSHAAIDSLLANPEYRIPGGAVLSRGNVERDGSILYLPLYAAWCLREMLGLASDDASTDGTGLFMSVNPV